TTSGTDRSTVSSTGASTLNETFTSSSGWNLYEAGSFVNGSWSLSSVAYGESFAESFSLQQTDSSSDSGTETASATDTNSGAGTTSYGGGAFNGTQSDVTTSSDVTHFSDSASDTLTQSAQDSSSLTEFGVFSGFSFSYASLVYQGGRS